MRTSKPDEPKDLVMGCDPGCSGCISVLTQQGIVFDEIRMDWTEADIARGIREVRKRVALALVEEVHSMPKQGVASSFKFGKAFGMMIGMLIYAKIRVEYITPKKWQQAMRCLSGGDKNKTKAAAQRLYPTRKITHRNADSILIAELARRTARERGWL